MIKHIWWDVEGTFFKETEEYKNLKYNLRYKLYSEIVGTPYAAYG